MTIKDTFRKFLRKAGFDISRFSATSHPLARRKQLLKSYRINVVLDIGANTGKYGEQLRSDLDYFDKIISFEPLSAAFKMLEASSEGDQNWDIFNIALGNADEKQEINIAGNSVSSSLLDMLPAHSASAPQSKYVGKETIEVKRLDSVFSDLCQPNDRVYMKMDTQGYESRVLKGAENSLNQISTVQMEMSLIPLYDGELLFHEMCARMSEHGYSMVAIEPGFADPESGQLLQVDGIFHRLQ